MSNSEERHTAWLDGVMDPAERRAFEAALPDLEAARREAALWGRLRDDLRESVQPRPMPHGDFLNAQVLTAISRPSTPPRPAPRGLVSLGRLAWAGLALLVLAAGLAFVALPGFSSPDESRFISQVIDARASDPALGAYAFSAPGGRGAVLWIQDAGYIPANEKVK